ncbi:MAG: hypothetical protein R2704_04920 [Microthrixaceae bacterium]
MSKQLSLLDLITDQIGPAPAGSATGGDPRVAAARASLQQASKRPAEATPAPGWVAVRLDAGTCELGRRRVAKAREVVSAARERAVQAAQSEANARQRAALTGVIGLDPAAPADDALQLPVRRSRRTRRAA